LKFFKKHAVRQNAGQAEEVASSSEEMLIQAEQMKTMVNGLTLAVEGRDLH
jgi:hypothetical protein